MSKSAPNKMDLELYDDNRIWRKATRLLLTNGEEMEVAKVMLVSRYCLLLMRKGDTEPILIQKHAIAYAVVDVKIKKGEPNGELETLP